MSLVDKKLSLIVDLLIAAPELNTQPFSLKYDDWSKAPRNICIQLGYDLPRNERRALQLMTRVNHYVNDHYAFIQSEIGKKMADINYVPSADFRDLPVDSAYAAEIIGQSIGLEAFLNNVESGITPLSKALKDDPFRVGKNLKTLKGFLTENQQAILAIMVNELSSYSRYYFYIGVLKTFIF